MGKTQDTWQIAPWLPARKAGQRGLPVSALETQYSQGSKFSKQEQGVQKEPGRQEATSRTLPGAVARRKHETSAEALETISWLNVFCFFFKLTPRR